MHTIFSYRSNICNDLVSYLKKELIQQEQQATFQQTLYYTSPLTAYGCTSQVREMVRTSFYTSPLKIKVDDADTCRLRVYDSRTSGETEKEIKLIAR